MMEQYRSLTVEAERFEQTAAKLESDRSVLRSDISNKEAQIRKLHDKVNLLEKECHQVMRLLHVTRMSPDNTSSTRR